MSIMKRMDEKGGMGSIGLVALFAFLLVAALAFGLWAFQGREDYKSNVDQKISAAVVVAKQQESTAKDKQFAEASKSPLKAYRGPEAFGSVVVNYPKTWSAYVDETSGSNAAIDGYFNPNFVPAISNEKNTFALRLQVLNQAYSEVLNSIGDQQDAPSKVSPYALPKVPKVVGVRVEGAIQENKTGQMVVLPLRDKTLEVWTESPDYYADFNNTILPNLSFSP